MSHTRSVAVTRSRPGSIFRSSGGRTCDQLNPKMMRMIRMILAKFLDDIGLRNVMKAYESNLGHDGLILGHAHEGYHEGWTSFVEWVETVETSLLVTILKISTHLWPLKHMKNQLKVSVAFKCSRFNMKNFNALQEPPPQVPSKSCLLPMIGMTSQ